MFQFPAFPSHRLCIHLWILKHYLKWVPSFGYLRVNGYLLLTAAFRSLSRPSSAPSAKASALCSSSLDLLLVALPSDFVATRQWPNQLRSFLAAWCAFIRSFLQLFVLKLLVNFLAFFWFSRFNIEIVFWSLRTHKTLKKHSCDYSRFRFRC